MNLSKLLKMFLPVSEEKKAEYLEKVRSLVDFYKPKIEKKTGIRLPKIEVKEELFNSFDENSKNKIIPKIKKLIHKNVYAMYCSGFDIYVPFSLGAKPALLEFNSYPFKSVDQIVVHELSHVLWNTIRIKNDIWYFPCSKKEIKDWKLINEGFACYCAQEWFADFYPENIKIGKQKDYLWRPSSLAEPYIKGKKKIESLVKEFGEEILFKIPEKWSSL